MRNKIIIGVLLFSVLVLASIGCALFMSMQIESNGLLARKAGDISSKLINFQSQYNLTHVEYLEYINDPNSSRLYNYNLEKNALMKEVEDIDSIAHVGGQTLVPEGKGDIQNIENDFKEVQSTIDEVFKLADEYQAIKNSGKSKTQIVASLRAKTFEVEKMFDQYGVEKIITNLSDSQKNLSDSYVDKTKALSDRIEIVLLFLSGFYMVLLALIAVSIGLVIKRINAK